MLPRLLTWAVRELAAAAAIAPFALTTPLPLKAPGRDVAAMGGAPWLTEARSARFWLAMRTCCC